MNICKRCNGTGVEPDQIVIGNTLKKLRQDSGMTLREMAREIGVSHSLLCQLENGRRSWRRSVQKRYEQAAQTHSKHKTQEIFV